MLRPPPGIAVTIRSHDLNRIQTDQSNVTFMCADAQVWPECVIYDTTPEMDLWWAPIQAQPAWSRK